MEAMEVLLQQMKEKEKRDIALTKRIKECESSIKSEEENIKRLQGEKKKLKEELERKRLEYSEKEIKREILQQQRIIWEDLLENSRRSLKEAESKLDDLRQSIIFDRISFCDDIKEFLDKHDLLKMSCGFAKTSSSPITITTAIKTENEVDEYNSSLEQVGLLEQELDKLISEEEQIEQAKQLKIQLQSEPSSGENFLRLQKSLKDMKDAIKNVDIQIEHVKNEISQKDLLIINRKNSETSVFNSSNSSQDLLTPSEGGYDTMGPSTSKQNVVGNALESKIVKFNESVQTKHIPPSPQLKSILKTKSFIAKSPSPSLKKKLYQQLVGKLDKEMRDILLKKK